MFKTMNQPSGDTLSGRASNTKLSVMIFVEWLCVCEIEATARNVACGVAVCARSKPHHVTLLVEWLCVRDRSHTT